MRDENGFELVDHDFVTGRTVWSYFDGEKTVYRIDYPADHIIRENEQVRNVASNTWKGDFHRVASVPLNLFYSTGLNRAIHDGDERFASKWLNDSDNRAWRTKEGTV